MTLSGSNKKLGGSFPGPIMQVKEDVEWSYILRLDRIGSSKYLPYI